MLADPVLAVSQDLEDSKAESSESTLSVPPPSSASKNILKGNDMNSAPAAPGSQTASKKLPRVILKLGPQPNALAESLSTSEN